MLPSPWHQFGSNKLINILRRFGRRINLFQTMKLQGRPCKFYMTVFLVNYICLTATPSRPGQERPNPLVSLVRSRLSSSVKRGDACLGVVARLGRDRTCKGGAQHVAGRVQRGVPAAELRTACVGQGWVRREQVRLRVHLPETEASSLEEGRPPRRNADRAPARTFLEV